MKPAKPFGLRTWSTPVTIGSFVLMAITGVLMFFDVVPGYLSFAHEWFSWLFLAGAIGHIVVNAKPFTRHLESAWGRASVGVSVVLLVVSSFSFGRITGPQLKWPIVDTLVEAPLSALAGVTRSDPGAVVNRLRNHGIAATPDQSVRELAARDDLDEIHVLGLVILRR